MTAAAVILAGGVATGAAPAHAEVKWLCRPDLAGSPCRGDLTTTRYAPDGSSRVEQVAVPADPPVDCFYVYPTVSNQTTPNATQTADPEVRSIAVFQAQRFSTRCRVYAPLYRQVTAAGVAAAGQTHDTSAYDVGFADVEEAWKAYLRDDNQGRGVVLVGHSQGSRILRALIRRDIDPDPAARDRLVSAIIPGANATTVDDKAIGACTAATQTGCVISYSTFDETPPDNARFGRTDTDPVGPALDLPSGTGREVLCTDPTILSGTPGRLGSLTPSEPFAPGVIAALLVRLYGGPPPTAPTPWLEPADHYTARCETLNGARVLAIAPVGAARHLTPSPDATWGTHLVDLNLPLDNLLTIVGSQSRSWLAAHRPLTATVRRGAVVRPSGRRRLVARVEGPPGRRVRVVLRRAGRAVAHRDVLLGAGGRGRVRFTVGRARGYGVAVRALS